jgi:hypothetical protein
MVARDRRLLYPENVNREAIAQSCLDQAGWAAKLGSPMYEALLRRMAEDVRAGARASPRSSLICRVRGCSRRCCSSLLFTGWSWRDSCPEPRASTPPQAGKPMWTRSGRICSKPFRMPRRQRACRRMRSNGPGPCYRDSWRSCGKLACPCGSSKSAQAPA